ncbi:hypothetical protein BFJ63_vAg10647 [Fusarium oxysporum f. sp. narcissi]|uniref:Uncharacterized protein n=3 Tax=Fusarium oxysporum TaxID=5507 RepID=A0A420QVF6_FUSOX|nr:hypothetical protein BFJ65_g18056 [Fusarium oxysporum f. sp. cepae]RKK98208.1 hypothetical protein BFJ71_g6926 [Fusarium oxysporum]RYC86505.1 hypothetical protein BFJ63_vAg10647 [Fusarium oxysporum f. sp. narcissi]RKK32498.1 hypothetical protein BFJ66_g15348 [Fusarium oxysporum f. sp. cepae]RKL08746.1 hypothetical protein BFJ68_g9236 [Fusarium oxysporum]
MGIIGEGLATTIITLFRSNPALLFGPRPNNYSGLANSLPNSCWFKPFN